MARFKYTDSTQGLFLAVNLKEQIHQGTFEWTVNHIIDNSDMSLFEEQYKNDAKGAAAYPPGVLLKIILFCYSRGIITSRKIETACRENIVVKALAQNCEPDHSTISAFISSNSQEVRELFAQVVFKCSELKLITGEMFAIDGCKLPSNASKECSGKIEEMKKKRNKLERYIERVISKHRELDKEEKAHPFGAAAKKLKQHKKTMGTRKDRKKKQLKRLNYKLKKLDEFLETAKPRIGPSGDEVKSNITDNESGFIKSAKGFIQGYNGVGIADSGNQVIVSAEVIGSVSESGIFPQMLDNLEENMKAVTGKEEPLKKALLEGDTGYFTEDNLQEAAKRGIEVLIPDPQFRQRDPHFAEKKEEKVEKQSKKFTQEDFEYDEKEDVYKCPAGEKLEYKGEVELRNNSGRKYQSKSCICVNCPLKENCITSKKKPSKNPVRTLYIADQKYEENLSAKMIKKIDEPVNRELYSRRQQIIEPVFSDIVYCKGMNRFTLSTKKKVTIQWQLYCIVHNIGKCV
jgi:transposase